ncbi:sigma 54-interacting transcriptional regulator [Marinomonas sp. THO17]|uniref:sigma-54 interaction domain-containing protein n=1 Tax=Marinomonas sp. THO17 TaxID=3149048 RepID=UPI00336BD077
MDAWLEKMTSLTVHSSSELFVHHLTKVFQQETALKAVYLLTLANDGRYFEHVNNDVYLRWDVADFDCALAHALQSDNTMTIQGRHLDFWSSDTQLMRLLKDKQEDDWFVFYPLKIADSKVELFYLFHGDLSLPTRLSDPEFDQFMGVCVAYLSLLREKERLVSIKNGFIQQAHDEANHRKVATGENNLANTIIGESLGIKKIREQIVRAAASNLTVMVLGETGTGKELVSKAVHDLSDRKHQEFVAINCAAIPDTLLESELFGHVKGAFSGAVSDKKGLFDTAHKGTLFLDEIGDMPLNLQAKILRVLETKRYRPVGSKQEFTSDFRLVVATHVNLREQVSKEGFRKDLFYRLYQYPIKLISLKERAEDIPYLAHFFIKQCNEFGHKQVAGISDQALHLLQSYDFPGNIRELKNLLQYACDQTDSGQLISHDTLAQRLDETSVFHHQDASDRITYPHPIESEKEITDLKEAVRQYESKILYTTLKKCNGNRALAAKSLGIPKRTLADKCLKLEIRL